MDWDRLPAARRGPRVDQLLLAYVHDEVLPFSATEPARFAVAGIGPHRLGAPSDLARLAPVSLAEVDGIAAVLRPTAESIRDTPYRWRWTIAGLTGRRARFVDEVLDPTYRAIHFDDHGPVVVASTAADLARLADLGRRWLALAGVRVDDAVLSVLPAAPDLAFWQLTLGCRRAGVPALHVGPVRSVDSIAPYAPTVLVGPLATIRRLAAQAELDPAAPLASVRLVLVTGSLASEDRVDLGARLPGAEIRAAWAPPGVRALWAECAAGGLHTWPDTEVVEVLDRTGHATADRGSVVWSPIGWRGTVVLRLRTGVEARLVDARCPCGATSPRLEVSAVSPPGAEAEPASLLDRLALVLDAEPLVAVWSAEAEPLQLYLGPVAGGRPALEAVLDRIGESTGALGIRVERPSAVRARIDANGGLPVAGGEGW